MPLRLAVFGLVGVAMAIGGVHGGTAYVPSVRLPIILFVFGVFIAGVLLFNAWKVFATSAGRAPPGGAAPGPEPTARGLAVSPAIQRAVPTRGRTR